MDVEDGEEAVRRGWLRWLGVGTGGLALVLVALWTQRTPIAENFVSRELNRRGVQANYDLTQVGLRTQRIENIVLGDPARPDLTARWVEIDIAFAGVTPQVAAVRAGGVRMHASLHDGIVRLGELDKFRDPDSTAPFSLPDILLALSDARLRFDTDAGQIGMRIDGTGNLRSGFAGKLAAVMPRAALAGCGLTGGTALLDITMGDGRPHIAGPIRADALACRDRATSIARPLAKLDVRLGKALDEWSGVVDLSGQALKSNGLVLAAPSGRIDFDGNARTTRGRARIGASALSIAGALARQAEVTGTWRVNASDMALQGQLTAQDVHGANRDPLAGAMASAAGTPVGPLVARLGDGVRSAGQDNKLRTHFALAQKGAAGSIVLTDSQFTARSGARAGVAPDGRVTLAWPGRGGAAIDWALDGALTTEGGGLPKAALRLTRRAGGGYGGQLFVDPYAAGAA
ncbi:MAG: exoprotein, partial [bacterium]|nr:exoprotein [bacterium]